jgi:hypothetical protein
MSPHDLTELHTDPTSHPLMSQILSTEALQSCRNNLEAIQNLRYLILLEVHDSKQVKLHLRMMDWHIHNLSDTLFQPDASRSPELH